MIGSNGQMVWWSSFFVFLVVAPSACCIWTSGCHLTNEVLVFFLVTLVKPSAGDNQENTSLFNGIIFIFYFLTSV